MLFAVEQLMEVNMGTLDKLKFVAVAPKRKQSIAEERRQKVVQQLTEQLKLAEAAMGGAPYQRIKQVWITDTDGNRTRAAKPARIRLWWQDGDNGTVQFVLRYGARPLEVRTGMAAVEVAKMADLPALIKTLMQAVNQVELDTQLAMAAVSRKPKGR